MIHQVTSTQKEPACNARNTQGACLVSVNNKLYLLGGEQRLALEYNPLSNQWVELVPPNLRYFSASGCCGVVMKPGKIWLCGGSTEEGEERNVIEEYDTSTKEWKTLDHLSTIWNTG